MSNLAMAQHKIKRYLESHDEVADNATPVTVKVLKIRADVVGAIVEDVRIRARKYDFSTAGSFEARQWLAQESSDLLNLEATEQEILDATNQLA
jgi:hypothetical protein